MTMDKHCVPPDAGASETRYVRQQHTPVDRHGHSVYRGHREDCAPPWHALNHRLSVSVCHRLHNPLDGSASPEGLPHLVTPNGGGAHMQTHRRIILETGSFAVSSRLGSFAR